MAGFEIRGMEHAQLILFRPDNLAEIRAGCPHFGFAIPKDVMTDAQAGELRDSLNKALTWVVANERT